MISPGVFFIFSKILIFWVVRGEGREGTEGGGGWKCKKWSKTKNSLSHSISHELYIIWLSFMVQMCKMINLLVFFFFIFSYWKKKHVELSFYIFWVVRVLKGQRAVQNDKRICLLHSISQEPYIIWLSFMV